MESAVLELLRYIIIAQFHILHRCFIETVSRW